MRKCVYARKLKNNFDLRIACAKFRVWRDMCRSSYINIKRWTCIVGMHVWCDMRMRFWQIRDNLNDVERTRVRLWWRLQTRLQHVNNMIDHHNIHTCTWWCVTWHDMRMSCGEQRAFASISIISIPNDRHKAHRSTLNRVRRLARIDRSGKTYLTPESFKIVVPKPATVYVASG